MKRAQGSRFRDDDSGAVAPTIALSLFALIAVGGIGFDYARMAAMDSELQNAADQAALAAATQLDGETDARTRATTAAQTLVTNSTLFSNDNVGSTAISIANVVFYEDIEKKTEALTDEEANFVEVTTVTREANFALTPIVAAFSSGPLEAIAFAGVGSSICNVPPVMICNPQETGSNLDFDTSGLIGVGIKLVSVGNNGGAWAPGNFGYLDTGSPVNNPNIELKQALGWTSVPGNCLSQNGVQTKSGAGTPITHAINTRFDIYEKGGPGGGACPTGGSCPASINSVKDLVRAQNANSCKIGPQGWGEPTQPYLPTSATDDLNLSDPLNVPSSMGHPRDKCHAIASPTCDKIGDGNWDRNAYFHVNYGWSTSQWQTNTGLGATPTRYQVYKWEIDNRGAVIGGKTILNPRTASGTGPNALIDHDKPVCSVAEGFGTGLVPDDDTPDRRRFSAAVVNCTAQSVNGGGGTVYQVKKWIELFVVEPSANRTRTGQQDVYVELIGDTPAGSGAGTVGQVVSRNVPYLIE